MPRKKKKEEERASLGDLLCWLQKGGWNMRYIEEVCRGFRWIKPEGSTRAVSARESGWSYTYTTAMHWVSDEQILKEIPARTQRDADAYGR